jgi:hypothetical protein
MEDMGDNKSKEREYDYDIIMSNIINYTEWKKRYDQVSSGLEEQVNSNEFTFPQWIDRHQ